MRGRHDLSSGPIRAPRIAQTRAQTYLRSHVRDCREWQSHADATSIGLATEPHHDSQETRLGVAKAKARCCEQMALFLALLKPTVNPPGATKISEPLLPLAK